MKVILLSDVSKLGKRFDVKEVAPGYALNLLIPKGLARIADQGSIIRIEQEKKNEASSRSKNEEKIISGIEAMGGTITMERKGNEKGHLFASVHKDEIGSLLKEKTGVEILGDQIEHDTPIKEAGEHSITVKVGDKSIKIKLIVKT